MKSVKHNLIMNILRLIMNMIFPLITFPYVSRILLPEGIGKISFAQSYLEYFMLFAMLGIPTYGIRVCSKVRDDKEKLSKAAKELFVLNSIMTGIVYFVFIIISVLWIKVRNDISLYIILSSMIFLNTIGMDWLFQALEKYSYITIRSFVFKLIGLILMVALVHTPEDYLKYAVILVISGYGSNIMNFIYSQRYISLKTKINFTDLKKHLKPILILFAISASASIYLNLDTLMLGVMKNNIEVGYYSTAIKVKNVVLNFITALGTVLLPRATYFLGNNMLQEYKNSLKKAFNYVKIISIPLMIFFIIYAKQCIYILAGEEYANAIPSMIAILPVVVFSGFSNIIGMQIFVANNKERNILIAAIIGALVDIFLNSLLIPKHGALGASIATTITELIVLLVEVRFMRNDNIMKLKIKMPFLKVICATIVSSAITLLFKYLIKLNNFGEIVVGALIFTCIYGIMLILLKEEMVIFYYNKYKSKIKDIYKKVKYNQ